MLAPSSASKYAASFGVSVGLTGGVYAILFRLPDDKEDEEPVDTELSREDMPAGRMPQAAAMVMMIRELISAVAFLFFISDTAEIIQPAGCGVIPAFFGLSSSFGSALAARG